MPSSDPRLKSKARLALRNRVKAERRHWCEHPACRHPDAPIDYDAPANTSLAFELDEVVPRASGGDPLDYANVRATHAVCNRAGGAAITNARRGRRGVVAPIAGALRTSRSWV